MTKYFGNPLAGFSAIALALTLLLTIGFTPTPAAACGDPDPCDGNGGTMFVLEIDTGIAGFGGVKSLGETTYEYVEKAGDTGFSANVTADTDWCPEGCGTGTATVDAWANEHVWVQGGALTETPDDAVTSVYNEAATAGRISVNFQPAQ